MQLCDKSIVKLARCEDRVSAPPHPAHPGRIDRHQYSVSELAAVRAPVRASVSLFLAATFTLLAS